MTVTRIGQILYFHRAVELGHLIYLSGVVGRNGEAEIAMQTRQVIDRMIDILRGSRSGFDRLLSVMIFVTEMAKKTCDERGIKSPVRSTDIAGTRDDRCFQS